MPASVARDSAARRLNYGAKNYGFLTSSLPVCATRPEEGSFTQVLFIKDTVSAQEKASRPAFFSAVLRVSTWPEAIGISSIDVTEDDTVALLIWPIHQQRAG